MTFSNNTQLADSVCYSVQEMPFFSDNVALYGRLFLPYGSHEKLPVVVLSCGIGGRKEWFEPAFPDAICGLGYALFTFDLRGHAPSQGLLDDGILNDVGAAVACVANHHAIDEEAIILAGQCLGSLLCNDYAARHSGVLGVANISTFLPHPFEQAFPREVNDMVLDQIVKSRTHHAEMDYDAFYVGFAQRCEVLNNAQAIAHLPSLFIHYDKDPICPSMLVKRYIEHLDNRNNELVILDNGHRSWISRIPHATSYDDPQIAHLVADWIRRKVR